MTSGTAVRPIDSRLIKHQVLDDWLQRRHRHALVRYHGSTTERPSGGGVSNSLERDVVRVNNSEHGLLSIQLTEWNTRAHINTAQVELGAYEHTMVRDVSCDGVSRHNRFQRVVDQQHVSRFAHYQSSVEHRVSRELGSVDFELHIRQLIFSPGAVVLRLEQYADGWLFRDCNVANQ
ncbi:hypothetical protein D3C80_754830 [compost metagenome]